VNGYNHEEDLRARKKRATLERQQLFKHLGVVRAFTLQTLDGLTPAQWTTIPEGFPNNILWNAAHIATTQARLLYRLSGLPIPVPDDFAEKSARDSSPKEWAAPMEPGEVLDILNRLVPQTIEDDDAGKFSEFAAVELRSGLKLDTFDEAVLFAIMHEGIHIGMIMQLKKLVK